jgi:CBS domain-containing protein
MDNTCVKDLMVPLEEYAVVSEDATLLDAVQELEEAQKKVPAERQPYRAVLVIDKNRKIVGKIGQLAFLKALEPKYSLVSDLGKLAQAGLSSEFISSMMEHFQLFRDSLTDLVLRYGSISVKDVMHPVTESVDENATLSEAIHRIVTWQTLSLLVTRKSEVVGLLRLSDVCDEVFRQMKARSSASSDEQRS